MAPWLSQGFLHRDQALNRLAGGKALGNRRVVRAGVRRTLGEGLGRPELTDPSAWCGDRAVVYPERHRPAMLEKSTTTRTVLEKPAALPFRATHMS